jgi:heme/copper-type cytochrome/quinol oxidase subunit 4
VFLCMVFLLVILVVATLLVMVNLNDKNGMKLMIKLSY